MAYASEFMCHMMNIENYTTETQKMITNSVTEFDLCFHELGNQPRFDQKNNNTFLHKNK